MNKNYIPYIVGIVSVLIAAATWSLDLMGLVKQCIYCRTERTVIGLIGILFLIPFLPFIRFYGAMIFSFFGAFVASDQIFMHMRETHISLMTFLAASALAIIMAQIVLFYYCNIYKKQSNHKREPQ